MDIIQLRNIKKQYGDKVIFQDVNFGVGAGAFVVLKGESGAGKSTLLNLIGGLEIPTGGQIIVGGKNVGQLSVKEKTDFYRHEIGVIFQGSYLQPQFSLFENITLPGVFSGINERDREKRAKELAEMFGISESLKLLPTEVSGGQAERACIARALFMSPKIILADEPTNNLDDANVEIVLNILNDLCHRLGITVIIASHSDKVLRFATQVIVIAGGMVRATDEAARNL